MLCTFDLCFTAMAVRVRLKSGFYKPCKLHKKHIMIYKSILGHWILQSTCGLDNKKNLLWVMLGSAFGLFHFHFWAACPTVMYSQPPPCFVASYSLSNWLLTQSFSLCLCCFSLFSLSCGLHTKAVIKCLYSKTQLVMLFSPGMGQEECLPHNCSDAHAWNTLMQLA